ncbi:uncharacterized protein A1O9_05655 [Exophiala aquamarina CBS 119918]|uniref:Formin GTPase-binding domain-containing protein n=1 Tax=Exophiala aquamarina CBS 119918 TaxID=1182545 RepID=A0A072PQF8_9EURO|nr:uncharacterized protein A1O9_05655 [Exophiala aquamarina CBS 119918]KEF57735.1 hypothetical protein A1O9_05655 [Exophiala aquamarina CBS 119918]
MAPTVHQVASIFEDSQPEPRGRRPYHSRVPSVGDVLRGRRKESNSPVKSQKQYPREASESASSPLGERHINSPPPPKRVPTKTGNETRPPATPTHKKTASSVSLKGFILGKEKPLDTGSVSSAEGWIVEKKPKKVKSATNLGGLLKRKSKKDLKEDIRDQENVSPNKQVQLPSPTPIWAQFATQPLENPDGTMHYPMAQRRTVEEEIKLYTPKDYSEFRPSEQRNFYGCRPSAPSPIEFRPPQRPFLEHKSSRSSIFTENLDEESSTEQQRPKSRDQSVSRPGSSYAPEARPPLQTRSSESSQTDHKAKRGSRVFEVIQNFNLKSRRETRSTTETHGNPNTPLSPQELDTAFEKVLDSLNIPMNMRDNMRNLKPDVKAGLMKGERIGSGSPTGLIPSDGVDVRSASRSPKKSDPDRPKSQGEDGKDGKRSRSRSRPRSRILTLSKSDESSPTKADRPGSSSRSRSKTRNKSTDISSSRPTSSRAMSSSVSLGSLSVSDSATTPGDFIHYLREVQKPELVEVNKVHKLRILLRNESISWTDHFVTKGGMDELIQLFYRIAKIEWREEHEDNLLHETLLCLKGLCTTSLALQRLEQIEKEFFPALLAMLFDPERKGPSEFATRGTIVSLLFAHLSCTMGTDEDRMQQKAEVVLGYLRDPAPEEGKQPPDFVSQMHIARPYRVWSKEVANVTKEVFWIFLHHLNVVPIVEANEHLGYMRAHYPALRPPHPAAPYVGGVEWEATQYLAIHLDLLNGIIASIPTVAQRNGLREELRNSGWEKVMGGSLRTCKEKFYSGVHDGLRCWVSAAKADGWPVEDVRAGPPREANSPRKSPVKKKADEIPQLALDVGVGQTATAKDEDGWM